MRVAVFGASGDQGAAQLRALARVGHAPIAISRRPVPVVIEGRAIETAAADFADPASVGRAIAGADAVFLNLPSTSFQAAAPLIAATRGVTDAAAAARTVRMLLFNTSMPVPPGKLGFAAQDARHEMRGIVLSGAVPAISFEPVVYLDNLLKSWAWRHIAGGTLLYPHHPELRVSWICHDDLARLMVAALDRPKLAGRSLPIGGPETVRLPELAVILSSAWGLPLAWRSQPVAEFAESMRWWFEGRTTSDAARMTSELARIYAWYNSAPEEPFCVDMAPVLAELPVLLTPIAEWARRQLLVGTP